MSVIYKYPDLSPDGKALCEFLETQYRLMFLHQAAKTLRAFKVPTKVKKKIAAQFEALTVPQQIAVVNLLEPAGRFNYGFIYRRELWHNWLKEHTAQHPEDAKALCELEAQFTIKHFNVPDG